DVPARREPQARVVVLAQQQVTLGRHRDDVRDEMARWRGRADPAEDVVGGGQPAQRLAAMVILDRIERRDAFDKLDDGPDRGTHPARVPETAQFTATTSGDTRPKLSTCRRL